MWEETVHLKRGKKWSSKEEEIKRRKGRPRGRHNRGRREMCCSGNGANVLLGGESRGRDGRDGRTADSFQHSGQLLLSACWQRRGSPVEILLCGCKIHWQTAETAGVLIAAVIPSMYFFQALKSVTVKYGFDVKSESHERFVCVAAETQTSCSWLIFLEEGKKKKKNPGHKHTHSSTQGLRIAAKWSQLWLHPSAV